MIRALIKFIATMFFLIVIGILFYFYIFPKLFLENKSNHSKDKEYVVINSITDGDTFVLSNGARVKLLGIKNPNNYDSSKLIKESDNTEKDKKTFKKSVKIFNEFIRNFLEGKKVYLEKESNYEDKDKNGILLRYVYLEDGTFVNGKIVKDGYAQVNEKFSISKLNELRKYQNEARENNRGLWGMQ